MLVTFVTFEFSIFINFIEYFRIRYNLFVGQKLKNILSVKDMDDILFDIGLSFTSIRIEPKSRHFARNPRLIFFYLLLFMAQKLLSIFCDDEITLLVVFGDVSHYYGFEMKVLLNVFICLECSLTLSSQVIYYYNHRRQIRPTFLRVFQKIANPNETVECDRLELTTLRALNKTMMKLMKLMKLNSKLFYAFCAGFNLIPILMQGYSLIEAIPLSLVSILTFAMAASIILEICGYQLIYFYILCKYLRQNVENLRRRIARMNSDFSFVRIDRILNEFDSLFVDIDEYNVTFWSKYLFAFWLTFGTAIILLISTSISLDIHLALKAILMYVAVLFMCLFVVTITSAASVNNRSNKCYQLTNSLFVSQFHSKQIRPKLKVCGNRFSVSNYQRAKLTECLHIREQGGFKEFKTSP